MFWAPVSVSFHLREKISVCLLYLIVTGAVLVECTVYTNMCILGIELFFTL